ncbi:hypothetical protein ABZ714_20040 [Streptomyces sp. NPDC006798]|uniref:hypothetical protein n=1 Tax=Streptomyces sp. NPDC006798 TaxID=3155462 RepID=UPI0033FC4E6E
MTRVTMPIVKPTTERTPESSPEGTPARRPRAEGPRRARLLLTALGATALAVAIPVQPAAADSSREGDQFTLISVDHIELDDPAEDVLEHAVILENAQILPVTHHHR